MPSVERQAAIAAIGASWQASTLRRIERERDRARRELRAVLGVAGKLTMLGFRRVAEDAPSEPPIGSPGCACRS